MGEIFIDIQFCAEGIVGLGLDPVVDDCTRPLPFRSFLTQMIRLSASLLGTHSPISHARPMLSSGVITMMLQCPILVTPLYFSF